MRRRYNFILPLLALLAASPAQADWDPELEAREAAERDAQARARQEEERAMQQQHDKAQAEYLKAQMDEKRKVLGAAAKGKSDAEVNALYDAKISSDAAVAYKAADTARKALSSGQGAAAVKQVTGKTLQELENMSEEEAEALSREMEQKYGQ